MSFKVMVLFVVVSMTLVVCTGTRKGGSHLWEWTYIDEFKSLGR